MAHSAATAIFADHFLFCPHCGRHIKEPVRSEKLILGAMILVEISFGLEVADPVGPFYGTRENIYERVATLVGTDGFRRHLAALVRAGYLEQRKIQNTNYYSFRLSRTARAAPGFLEEVLLWSRACVLPTKVSPREIARVILAD